MKHGYPAFEIEPMCRHNIYRTIVQHKKEEMCDVDGKLYTLCLTRYEFHCECGKKMFGRWFVDSDENLHQIELRERMRKELLKEWKGER